MAKDKEQAPQQTALALPGKPMSMEVPEEWGGGFVGLKMLTSIDQSTPQGKSAIVDCIDGECEEAAQWINRQFAIAHVLLHPVAYTDEETGEEIRFIRCVAITDEGRRIQFGSVGIVKSLQLLTYNYGNPPWSPALKVELQRIPTSGGRSRYRLRKVD